MRAFLIFITALWTAALFGTLIFWAEIAESIFCGTWIALLVLAIGLCFVALAVLFCLFRHPRVAVLCGVVAGLGAWFAFHGGAEWGEDVRFRLVRAKYEAELARVLEACAKKKAEAPRLANAGDPFGLKAEAELQAIAPHFARIEDGPPMRIAFFWLRGVVDHWAGLVYDPSGEVLKANRVGLNRTAPEPSAVADIRMLFGGKMYHARQMSGHWYLCWFT